MTRHNQLGLHVRQTGAKNVGAGTHKLGAKDDGAEHRVHFLKCNCQGHNCAKKTQKGPICIKVAPRTPGTPLKRPDPLGLKYDTITSPRRLVTTFLTSNSTEFE
jgi:hypothetical protein